MSVDFSEQTTSGLTVKAIYLNPANGQAFNGTGFEAWQDAHYSTYAVAATELGSSGTYIATTPAAVLALGVYHGYFVVYTGTLATDVKNKIGTFDEVVAADSSGRVTAAPAQSFNNTGQTTALPTNVSISILPAQATIINPMPVNQAIFVTQYAQQSIAFTINDASGNPINLSAKTIHFRASNQNGTLLISYNSGTSQLTVGGTNNNVVTINFQQSDTSTAFGGNFVLWDTTDELPLARGTFEVTQAISPT